MMSTQKSFRTIVGYTYPKLYTGVEWYVGFTVYDPASGIMKRKKIKLNFIDKVSDRRKYASSLIAELSKKLETGWNPFIEAENGKAYHTFKDVCEHYRKFISKMFSDNIYREDTYTSYLSYIRNIEQWNNNRKTPITYIYQFDRSLVNDFLEHIYIDRNNTAQTRNNYLGFIRVFSTFLLQNQYVNVKPSDGIASLGRRMIKKQRTIISDTDMIRLAEYLTEKNKHYLLACYILHYCFIRPKEMSYLKISDFSLKDKTLYISDEKSKNRKSGTVTLPIKVIHLMLDLKIFESPGNYYLFSSGFEPGKTYRSEKAFRDYWFHYVRKNLKFPSTLYNIIEK